ncbi:hypothetical protein THAOC_25071 [Thalassiosira oceanica]|uniref:DUF6743 domain-containing protein n=1 Tax=Thalassiosira oceanica TaxID=159749 RepID=K0S925_THAOC|nr:hypothetical protein THAOC_25071 [Thalassiosira oceanica]|eukprot:EJK55217.1 hypothetical protein THAOC_25071 [Thalassiosira oceanica]
MWTSKEWMREDTWHFEVEVLRIYGRQELWSDGFGARPVSDGPYQPVDAADVRRRVAFGARQDNEFAVRHCCVHRSRWSAVSGTRVPRGTSKPLVMTSLVSEREEAVRPQIEFSAVDLLLRKISNIDWRSSRLLPTERKGVRWRIVPFNACRHSVEPLAAPAPSLPLPAGGLPGGGSSYGARGRPPDTTGRSVPLTGFPRGFLEEGSRPRIEPTPAGTTLPSYPTTIETLHQATNVEANFDFDGVEAKKMGCHDLPDDKGGGVQQHWQDYLEKLVEQLLLELNCSTKNRDQQWLLCHLRANDWWIRQVDARRIAKNLRLTQFPKVLYRDVYVWLPDVMWPGSSEKSEMMPCCPNCLTNERVAQHCCRENHYGRLIIGLNTTYYDLAALHLLFKY